MRFVDAAIIGPYRDRFPQGKDQVARCVPSLFREVEAGRLAPGALHLLDDLLAQDDDLRRAAYKSETSWDGTLVIKSEAGKLLMAREQVVPVADTCGRDSGFHVSLWLPMERDLRMLDLERIGEQPAITSQLTPRQLELACWYAAGLTSREVAARAQITVRTARDHLEEIYSRLDVHSRAELTALLVREGLA